MISKSDCLMCKGRNCVAISTDNVPRSRLRIRKVRCLKCSGQYSVVNRIV